MTKVIAQRRHTVKRAKIIVITGRSASGKTVLTNSLMAVLKNVGTIRATTTRLPRPDDSSSEYEFVSYKQFWCSLLNDEFVSWRKSSKDPDRTDDLYSVRVERINEALESDKIFVRSLTPDTISRWHTVAGENIVFIHLVGPDEKEARKRMDTRGGMTQAQIDERIREEENWDKDILALIERGIPICVIPDMPLGSVLEKTLEIVGI